MALWNGNWGGEDKNFINLKLTSTPWPIDSKDDAPYFERQIDFKSTGEKYTSLSGKLVKIKGTHTPAKGKMGDIYWFRAFFEDGDDIYVVDSTITNASKDLLNALLANVWVVLSIALYVNKNNYPASSVKLENGNYAQTKLDFQEASPTNLYEQVKEQEGEKEEEGATPTDLDKIF